MINMLKKWMPRRVVIMLLILLAVHLSSYYGAKAIIADSEYINMALPIDSHIPLLPWTVIIYYGCFFVWIINYTNILRTEPEGTYRYMCAEILGKIICFICYVLIPTVMIRPEVNGTGFFPDVIRMMYSIDPPNALFPSMHCFVSWMCVVGLRGKPEISRSYRVFSVVAAILVFVSTVTTKQHVVIDAVAAVALAEFVWFVAKFIPIGKKDKATTDN